eukprot:TRINITY_DN2730_c0_g1_i2.p1 TRINITY_DN2730_c0_g1~~TRINITY_DN2730_c0_g1_i2.p1  ORF type:complete len:237 (-),score=28.16 TRINITY_DN2730_c0_g1_i2:46-756(-)
MYMQSLVFLCVATFLAVVSAQSCLWSNDCVTQLGKPNCVNTIYQSTVKQCRQCADNCDCAPGQFCPLDTTYFDQDEIGVCQYFGYKQTNSPLGRQCIELSGQSVVHGENDQLFCGLITSFAPPATQNQVAWQGSCNYGVCAQCQDGSEGTCGYNPRVCVGGKEYQYWFVDFTVRTLGTNVAAQIVLAFLLLFVFVAIIASCCACCRIRRRNADSDATQQHLVHSQQVTAPVNYGTA